MKTVTHQRPSKLLLCPLTSTHGRFMIEWCMHAPLSETESLFGMEMPVPIEANVWTSTYNSFMIRETYLNSQYKTLMSQITKFLFFLPDSRLWKA